MSEAEMYTKLYSLVRRADRENDSAWRILAFIIINNVPNYVMQNVIASLIAKSVDSQYSDYPDLNYHELAVKHNRMDIARRLNTIPF